MPARWRIIPPSKNRTNQPQGVSPGWLAVLLAVGMFGCGTGAIALRLIGALVFVCSGGELLRLNTRDGRRLDRLADLASLDLLGQFCDRLGNRHAAQIAVDAVAER